MVIAFCDDDKQWAQSAVENLSKYAQDTGMDVEIHMFQDGHDLLDYTEKAVDVIFMDIHLEEMSGIEVASVVNERWSDCQIVFVTNYIYYAVDIYHAEHSFFLLKDQFADKLPEVFTKLSYRWNQGENSLIFDAIKGPKIILQPKEILYFERVKRVTIIRTKLGRYEVWDKISTIEKVLPEIEFVRCHNSYIVYLPSVREMYKNAFVLRDGTKIAISRSYTKKVEEAFNRWAQRQML